MAGNEAYNLDRRCVILREQASGMTHQAELNGEAELVVVSALTERAITAWGLASGRAKRGRGITRVSDASLLARLKMGETRASVADLALKRRGAP